MISGKADCGMQYAVRRSSSSAGYCALSIKCGTRDEDGFRNGTAHFTEHTLFKGTAHRSASVINGYLDRLGGELNAYTTKEEIVFHATVLKEDLGKAASLLFELATEPTFPEHEIETEKGVVIDEIQSCKDSPAEDIYDRFEQLLFSGHPLGNNILGTAASVRKITREDLVRFVHEKFRPERIAFTAVADIDEKKMEKAVLRLAGKFFGGGNICRQVRDCQQSNDSRQTPVAWTLHPEPVPFDKTVNKRSHQANCVIGGLAPSLYQERERIAAVLLCNILGGPASNSMLNSVLREKNGWVYGVECSYTQYADTGIAAICLGCDKDNLPKCRKAIEKILRKLQEEPLSERRLKAAKKQLLGQMAVSSDNGETQCLSMGKSLLAYGKVTSSEQTRKLIGAVTAEDIREMARMIFAPEKLSRLVYL